MNARPQWSYVRARLQARHGGRLGEDGWRALEAAQSIDEFLDRARAGPLRRFIERINAGMEPHAIERTLRAEWRIYVGEIAGWMTPAWRPAVLWATWFADLPAIAVALADATPDWVWQDTVFADLAEADAGAASVLAPLAKSDSRSLTARWLSHWRTLWPRGSDADRRGLKQLITVVTAHFGQLSGAHAQEASGPYRRDLDRVVRRLFRRDGAAPAAVFCHLIFVALDLERLRGGLLRRRLFAPATAKVAA